MATGMIDKQLVIARTAEEIYAYLIEPQHYIGLQPLVIAVENEEKKICEDGIERTCYDAVERLKFLGVFTFNNPIHACMTRVESNRHVRQNVTAALGVRVQQDLLLASDNGQTHLTNRITYEAPIWLKWYLASQIEQAHTYFLHELKRRLETHAPTA